jgi:FdhD protein
MNLVLPSTDLPTAVAPAAQLVSAQDSGSAEVGVCVAEEVPVAFRFNGFPHAVMMASPTDLVDFAYGFSLSEGIIVRTADIEGVGVEESDDGIRIDVSLSGHSLHRYLAHRRVRRLSGNTSCGLCGVEDLADVAPIATHVPAAARPDPAVIRRTADQLRQCQPLSRLTRGAHAAAWISANGAVQVVREDVGRHNALDKLVGALLRNGRSDGFCLITSRCSYEMVQKAAAAGFSALVAISSPTGLAIRTAQAAGMNLYALAPDGTPLLFAAGVMA